MKKMLAMFMIFLLPNLCLSSPPAGAAAKKQFPIELSFINHAITMPFDRIVLSPLHPGFSLGTEYAWKVARLGRLFQGFHAGYFYNEFTAQAVFLQTEIGFRLTLRFGLFADVEAGIGYLHSFHPREIFRLNDEGEFVKAKDGGKSAALFSAGLGIGIDFSRKLGWPVSVFIRYQPFIQTPYTAEESILPQSFVHFGVRFKLW